MSKKKQYNQNEIIINIRSSYLTNKQFNIGFEKDRFHPFTPELDLKNYPNYSKKSIIMVCKLEDIQFLILQGHPKQNIIYVADNHVRQTVAQTHFKVQTVFYSGAPKEKQQMLRIMKDFNEKVDITIFRNRATKGGDKHTWTRYKKIAYSVTKDKAYISVTCVPMAVSIETREQNHDVIAFSIGRLEKNSADGGYVGVMYHKNSAKEIKPKILKPIDPKSKLAHSIIEKVLEPDSFEWFHNSKSQIGMEKRREITYGGNPDTIIRLTGNANQPFEYGNVNHKDIQPKGLYILANKHHNDNPANCIATTQANFAHISYTVSHSSWKKFADAQLMATYFRKNNIRTFLCNTLGLKHRTYFCFWKAFNVREIKLSTDYPPSYQLTDKEKQDLDSL